MFRISLAILIAVGLLIPAGWAQSSIEGNWSPVPESVTDLTIDGLNNPAFAAFIAGGKLSKEQIEATRAHMLAVLKANPNLNLMTIANGRIGMFRSYEQQTFTYQPSEDGYAVVADAKPGQPAGTMQLTESGELVTTFQTPPGKMRWRRSDSTENALVVADATPQPDADGDLPDSVLQKIFTRYRAGEHAEGQQYAEPNYYQRRREGSFANYWRKICDHSHDYKAAKLVVTKIQVVPRTDNMLYEVKFEGRTTDGKTSVYETVYFRQHQNRWVLAHQPLL